MIVRPHPHCFLKIQHYFLASLVLLVYIILNLLRQNTDSYSIQELLIH